MGAHSFKEAAEMFAASLPNETKEQLKYIDSHCHYEAKKFDKNRYDIIKKVQDCCKNVICVGTNIRENAAIEKLSNKYEFMYSMYGFFPTSVDKLEPSLCKDAEKNFNELIRLLKTEKCVGLGEIGLDYNWDCVGDVKGKEAREIQKKWFENQIDIAIDMGLPISIHSRDAEEDTINILDKYYKLRGVVHCFSYSTETAIFCVKKGLKIGIGGTSTYKANVELRKAIEEIPLENIVLETDAPYLSPEPVRRSINDSTNIKYVISNISNIKNIAEDDIIKQTNENCKQLFGI